MSKNDLRVDVHEIKQKLTRIENNIIKTTTIVKNYAIVTTKNRTMKIDDTSKTRNIAAKQKQLKKFKKRKTMLIKFKNDKKKQI